MNAVVDTEPLTTATAQPVDAPEGSGVTGRTAQGGADLVTVIIPACNVAPYVAECLDSVLGQGVNLEVIFVDDGSTDDTAAIAETFAARDPRVTVLRQQNRGPAEARNLALRSARGTFLAFVDADDYLLPGALATMLASLKSNSADFVTANVQRNTDGRLHQSGLHAPFTAEDVEGAHISTMPTLLWDTVSWNKLYRRAFFMEAVGSFPDMLYEDMLPMAQAHLKARKVNVLSKPVYVWRARPDKSSITQGRASASAFADRARATREIFAFLKAHKPELLATFELKVLRNDMMLYMDTLSTADDVFREVYVEAIPPLLNDFSATSFDALSPPERLLYELVRRGRLYDLPRVLPFTGKSPAAFAVLRDGGRHVADLPFRTGWNALPAPLYDVTERLRLLPVLAAVRLKPGGCIVTGHAPIESLPATTEEAYEIEASLLDMASGEVLPLRVERQRLPFKPDPQTLGASLDYGWTAFSVEIDFIQLSTMVGARNRRWQLSLSSAAGGMARTALHFVGSDDIEAMGRQFGPCFIKPALRDDGAFVVVAELTRALLVDRRLLADGSLALRLRPMNGAQLKSVVLLAHQARDVVVEAPLEPIAGSADLGARVSAEALAAIARGHPRGMADLLVGDAAGARHRLRVETDAPALAEVVGSLIVEVRRTVSGNLLVQVSKDAILLERAELSGARVLLRGTTSLSEGTPLGLTLENLASGELFPLFAHKVGQRMDASVDLLHVERSPGRYGPLPVGKYALRLAPAAPAALLIGESLFAGVPASHVHAGLQFEFSRVNRFKVALRVNNRLADDERGPANQKKLVADVYTPALAKGVRQLVVFESWNGKRIDDNPLALYREFQRSHPEIDVRFAVADAAVYVPKGVKTLNKWSRRYYEELGTASLLVVNDRFPPQLVKRQGQFAVQTWHGTPLKRIGFDIDNPTFDRTYLDQLAAEVPKWDLLLSPNVPSTTRFRSAFRYPGEVIEVGYPRNDILSSPGRDAVRAQARRALRLAEDDYVILYAPTWRDNKKIEPGRYRFDIAPDFGRLAATLGKVKVLSRGHHLSVMTPDTAADVIDVTSYPDVSELYLAADALVSDYSSSIVDFSITGKPILLYTPDLAEFGTTLRGFYGKFTEDVPAPFLLSTDELIEAVRETRRNGCVPGFDDKYRRWRFAYTFLEDGHSARRTVQRLLATG